MLLHSEKSLPCTVDISRELYETVIGESFQIRVKIVVGSESAGDKRSVDSFNLTGFSAEANGGIAAGRIIGVEVRVRGYYPGPSVFGPNEVMSCGRAATVPVG